MESQKIDMFMMANAENFEPENIEGVRTALAEASEEKWGGLQALGLKKPTTMLIISFLGGAFGIDRFMLGDTKLGVAKLLTCGGLGIWAIIDLFMIQGAAKKKNLDRFQSYLNG